MTAGTMGAAGAVVHVPSHRELVPSTPSAPGAGLVPPAPGTPACSWVSAARFALEVGSLYTANAGPPPPPPPDPPLPP